MISEQTLDAAVKRIFSQLQFTSEPAGLYDPLRYMMGIGGKRLRPRLCLLAYSLYKDEIDDSVAGPVSALEVYHTFTLIHDDIMDKSPLRRGMPTVWTKWGDDTAILSGDVMSIESFRLVCQAPKQVLPAALELFTTTAAQVCDGQQYDMDFEKVPEVSMEDYIKMIGLKTGVLIACSAKMGGILAGASEQDCDLLYEYGYQMGLAFQVADDYLDTYGDEKVFGKPIGGDIVNNKKSWTITKALETVSDKAGLMKILTSPAETKEEQQAKIDSVRAIYDKAGVPQAAKDEIVRLTGLAMDAVNRLSVSEEGKARLRDFAHKLVGRAS